MKRFLIVLSCFFLMSCSNPATNPDGSTLSDGGSHSDGGKTKEGGTHSDGGKTKEGGNHSDGGSRSDGGKTKEAKVHVDTGIADKGKEEPKIGNDIEPKKIKGGGFTGGDIDGRVNVYVLSEADEKPLSGAFVMLGAEKELQGTTDQNGLFTLKKPGFKGPITITLGSKGYATETIVGLNTANITILLENRSDTGEETPKVATITGLVKDFDKLPPAPKGQVKLSFVMIMSTQNLVDPGEDIEQPKGDKNIYAPSMGRKKWLLKVPAGVTFGVYVVVLDLDSKAPEGDRLKLTHVGFKKGLKLKEGEQLDNIEVSVVPASETLKLKMPEQPVGTDGVFGFSIIMTPHGELMRLLPFFTVGGLHYPVPKLTGLFEKGEYWGVFGAEKKSKVKPEEEERETKSFMIVRGHADLSKKLTGKLLDLPSGHLLKGRTLSYTAPSSVAIHSATLMPEKSGLAYWKLTFLKPQGKANSFTLPEIPKGANVEPLPKGKLFYGISLLDIEGLDLKNVQFEKLKSKFKRIATRGAVVEMK